MNNEVEQVQTECSGAQCEKEVEDTEVCDHETVSQSEDDSSRWSYFLVSQIAHEFSSKMDLKKWLQEFGVGNFIIIRGRTIPTNEKIRRVVTIG